MKSLKLSVMFFIYLILTSSVFAGDYLYFTVGDEDGRIIKVNETNQKELEISDGVGEHPRYLNYHQKENKLFFLSKISDDQVIRVKALDPINLEVELVLTTNIKNQNVTGFTLTPEGDYFCLSYHDNLDVHKIMLFDLENKSLINEALPALEQTSHLIGIQGNRCLVATKSNNSWFLRIINPQGEFENIFMVDQKPGLPTAITRSPKGDVVTLAAHYEESEDLNAFVTVDINTKIAFVNYHSFKGTKAVMPAPPYALVQTDLHHIFSAYMFEGWNQMGISSSYLSGEDHIFDLLDYADGLTENYESSGDLELNTSQDAIYATAHQGIYVRNSMDFPEFQSTNNMKTYQLSDIAETENINDFEIIHEDICGDEALDPGEVCDEGDLNGQYGHCSSDCQMLIQCGDGQVNGSEACDDGESNGLIYGQCNQICSGTLSCGDGDINGPETCDDGIKNGELGYCQLDCQGMVVENEDEVDDGGCRINLKQESSIQIFVLLLIGLTFYRLMQKRKILH